jgi:hypothetical protein
VNVSCRHARVGAPEAINKRRIERENAAARRQVAHHLAGEAEAARAFVDGLCILHAGDKAWGIVIAQILANARQGVTHRYAVRLEQLSGSDARELQQLRRIITARRQDHGAQYLHLAPCPTAPADGAADGVGDPGASTAFEIQLGHMRVGANCHVAALAGRVQECGRSAYPATSVDGALGIGDAFLGGAVVVGIAGYAETDGTGNEGFA